MVFLVTVTSGLYIYSFDFSHQIVTKLINTSYEIGHQIVTKKSPKSPNVTKTLSFAVTIFSYVQMKLPVTKVTTFYPPTLSSLAEKCDFLGSYG